MADPQLYTALYITANGMLLSESAEVQMTRSSNSQPNTTIAKGYAGETAGAPTCTMQVTNMVPSSDFELDAGQLIEGVTPVEMGLVGPGGKQCVVKGFIIEDSLSYSVNATSSYQFQFRGSMPQFA